MREEASPVDLDAARPGQPVPHFAAVDADGNAVESAQLPGSVTVLTFVSLAPGPSAERSWRIVERLESARRRFPRGEQLRILVVVMDDAPVDALARLGGASIEALVEPRPQLEELAARFGITVFRDPQGPVHASETVVVDSDGIVAAIWPGIDGWSEVDLLEAVARRLPR